MSEAPDELAALIPDNVRALREIFSSDAGRVVLVEPTDQPPVPYVDKLRAELRRGQQVLDKPRPTWLIPHWLPNHSVAVLYGPPGAGKSFVALSLALELARGGEWCGQRLEPTTVLYVAAERATILGDRQEAWTIHNNAAIPERFLELSAAPPLRNAESSSALIQIIRENHVQVVVVDTLAQMTLGTSENDGREWGEVVAALNMLRDATDGGSVIAVHHSGKDPTKGDRGHTVMLGSVDARYELTGDAQAIKLRVNKLNAGPHPMPEWFRLHPVDLAPDADGTPRTGAVLMPSTGRDATDPRRNHLLDLLEGDFSDVGMSRADVESGLDIHRNTAQALLKALKNDGLIVSRGNGTATRYYRAGDMYGQDDLLTD